MRLPKSIRIAGREWSFERRRKVDSEHSLGETNFDTATIAVKLGLKPFDLKDTVLHETCHAILHGHSRVRTVEEEEWYVNTLSTALIGVFQDNPELARWLVEQIPKKAA
jgi:predicted SprT family Zn-dependent metalloprotease